MARQTDRLTARTVASITKPGRHADGGNLYLSVSRTGAKSWVFFYKLGGRQREMGLGNVRTIGLARAREMATRHRQALLEGIDPLSLRKAPKAVTFGKCADDLIASMSTAWRGDKQKAQWCFSLSTYAASLRTKSVDTISTEDVLGVLKPIWATKPETASRVRGRIEAVLNAATASGRRTGDNPARWRGHLSNLLPKHSKASRGHHRALRIADLPSMMAVLRNLYGVSARALEFGVLTAARTGEVLGARWSEVDSAARTWTVPANRMKGFREHRVPLGAGAIAIVEQMAKIRHSEFVFPGRRPGKPLSETALGTTLERLKVGNATVHGFRSTFRDWCSEETGFPSEVVEMALAHAISNKTEAAYRRGDLFAKRRQLMAAWDQVCATACGNVVALHRESKL